MIPLSDDNRIVRKALYIVSCFAGRAWGVCVHPHGFIPESGRPPGEGMAATPGSRPGESRGQRHLAGCSPQDHRESDTTEAT